MAAYEPAEIITSLDQVRAVIPNEYPSQTGKIIDHIDTFVQAWIERSPFVTIGTYDRRGNVDVAPKGDPAGFVKVIDRKTLAIPDRPGNHRFDTFENILETGRIGLMFMVPNRNEVVRVNGSARIVRDLALREAMAVNRRLPEFAILVGVEEAFYHCGKAVIRSRLWQPDQAASTDGLPTYAQVLIEHARLERSLEEMERITLNNDQNRLYDE